MTEGISGTSLTGTGPTPDDPARDGSAADGSAPDGAGAGGGAASAPAGHATGAVPAGAGPGNATGAVPAGGGPGRRRRRRRGRAAAVVTATALAVAAGAAAAVGFGGDDPGTATASHLPPANAQVTRQTLIDSETADGELGYGETRTVAARKAGTVTSLAAAGTRVTRGKPLYSVDNQKVVLLYGGLPAYRTLRSGDSGDDVEQFEKNLSALGYDGFTVDDEYTSATAEAVRDWQDDLGLDETGRVELGQVVYATGEVRVDSIEAEGGDAVQPGAGVLSYSGTSRVVTVSLDVDDQRLAKRGAKVTVTLPDGKAVPGTVAATETVIETSSGANGQDESETRIEVTVTAADPKALAGFDSASVDVAFTAAERKDVLTVPVAALLALAEGGYGVEIVEGDATRIVAVQTGLFASGRVEVTGDGLVEGATVGMPK
ncbi:peptidoglycan-binding domain-containing protein [Micromonospora sp. WMMD1102]|uniref:efflux RND transporter periplasmic adaptor subunit n=1 Tax=Micromonospora sp. WMMD1102 TaxID=3016105 RepID=UPI0024151105|nr:peptidoglycan-binding domain-containing protein [Micromonospora sp. WMMD1102]MDG4791206.1 peptidoglycan-binding domain-containing protein [Micromonospora sp. WMMD1102]